MREFRTDEFKLIIQAIFEQYFDKGIYQTDLSDHKPELVDKLVLEKVRLI
jgi:hypothetical protein